MREMRLYLRQIANESAIRNNQAYAKETIQSIQDISGSTRLQESIKTTHHMG